MKQRNHIDEFLWSAGKPIPPRSWNNQAAVLREIMAIRRKDWHVSCLGESSSPTCEAATTIPASLPPSGIRILICVLGEGGGSAAVVPRDKTVGWRTTASKRSYTNMFSDSFLTSIALLQHESDFGIAQSLQLLPRHLTQETWACPMPQVHNY